MAEGSTFRGADGVPADPAGIGIASPRIDGRAKVTGTAHYGSDIRPSGALYGALRTSAIARGRITSIDETAARRVPGVMDILTYRNVGKLIDAGKTFDQKGYMGTSIAPLASDRIHHDGQIVALVVADTRLNAQEAANQLKIAYAEETPSGDFDSAGISIIAAEAAAKKGGGGSEGGEGYKDPKVGDAETAFAAAPVRIDARYETPIQHHNPDRAVHHHLRVGWAEADRLGVQPERLRLQERLGAAARRERRRHPRRFALHRRRLRFARLADPAHRDHRVRGQAYGPSGDGGGEPGRRLHHRHLPRRHPPPHSPRRQSRRQAAGPDPRGLGVHLPARRLQGGRDRRLHPHLCLPQRRFEGLDRARRSQHAGLHAGPGRDAVPLRPGIGDGRTGPCAEDGPGRAAPGQRHPGRADQGPALYQPPPGGMPGRRLPGVRLVEAQPRARLHARRRLAGRLRHGEFALSHRGGAGGGAGDPVAHGSGQRCSRRPTRSATASTRCWRSPPPTSSESAWRRSPWRSAIQICRPRPSLAAPTPPPASATWWPRPARTSATVWRGPP